MARDRPTSLRALCFVQLERPILSELHNFVLHPPGATSVYPSFAPYLFLHMITSPFLFIVGLRASSHVPTVINMWWAALEIQANALPQTQSTGQGSSDARN